MSEVINEIEEKEVVVDLKILKTKKEKLKFENSNEYEEALNQVKILVTNTELNLFNLSSILKDILEVVDAYGKIKGTEKKQFSLAILESLLDEKDFGEEEAILSRLLDNGSVGNLIDIIIAASHGDLNLNNLVEPGCKILVGCTKACFPKFIPSMTKLLKIKK